MKKILALALCLMLALSLVACTGSKTEEDVVAPTDVTEPVAEEVKVLTMATNAEFPPYEFYDGDVVVGIDAEVAAVIAEKLGMELEIVDTAFDSIIPAIVAGKYSMGMAGMTVTEERLQEVNFSTSYAKGVQVVIVPEGSAITTVDDLFVEGRNYIIGVQTGTTGDLYSTWDIEDAGLGTVSRYNKGADAVEALKVGKVDCVIIDNEPAKAFVADSEGLTILDTAYAEEDYAIAVNKNDTQLLADINAALEELMADGTLQAIVDKYISAE